MATRQVKSHRPAPEERVKPLPPDGQPAPTGPAQTARTAVLLFALLVGAIGGIWLGSSFSRGRADNDVVTNLGAAAQADGLAVAIAGFPDTLLVVGTNGSEPFELATWPPAGRLAIRALPAAWTAISFDGEAFGDFAEFDASGKQVALAAPVAREQSFGLFAGRPEEPVPVATGVTSYTWHRETPRSLAYVVGDEERWIEVMAGAPRSVERIRPVPANTKLAAWGGWGYLIARDNELTLLDSPRGWFSGRFLAASAAAILIERSGELGIANPDGSDFEPFGEAGAVVTAAFDRSGDRIAVGRTDGLTIVGVDGANLFELEHAFIEDIAWSRDGAFVVFADRLDVHILEVATESVTATGLGPAVDVATRSTAIGSD